jgi:uncharacterized protein
MTLPQASRPFVEFPQILRAHGFAVSPDQTMGFIEAVGLLGPRDMIDIRRAAISMLSVPRERHSEFDALFRAYFMGQSLAASIEDADGDDEIEAFEPTGSTVDVEEGLDESEAGDTATTAEILSRRKFVPIDDVDALRHLARRAEHDLPRRISYRRSFNNRGNRIDLRRALRQAIKRDGEVFDLPLTRRKTRQRRILLLVDVSGSMRDQSEATLRFAYALTQAAERVETFTLGTRLTRVTHSLRIRNRDQALDGVGASVADFDGGTRIGDALEAFLSVPRFAGYARGAAVLIVSDGLERGSPDSLVQSIQKLSRLTWKLDWLTPLAAEPGFEPRTEALAACLPHLDSLVPGDRIEALCSHVLSLSRSK